MHLDSLIDDLLDREGGYVHHHADRGGPTCWGVTEAVARAGGYTGPMRALPRDAATTIYRRLYWYKPGFDLVDVRAPRLAAELFDTGVNMGPAVATAFLQRALNALNRGASDYPDLGLDGAVGPRTLAALDAFLATRGRSAEEVLLKAVEALQGERYLSLAERRPANEAFLYGWLANRLGEVAPAPPFVSSLVEKRATRPCFSTALEANGEGEGTPFQRTKPINSSDSTS